MSQEPLYAQCKLYEVELNPNETPKWLVKKPLVITTGWIQASKEWVGKIITLKGRTETWIISTVSDVRLPQELLHKDWPRGEYEDTKIPRITLLKE